MTKTVAVLGSTGSIGRQTLQVVQELGLTVAALTANRQVDLLEQQARQFHPKLAVLYDRAAAGFAIPWAFSGLYGLRMLEGGYLLVLTPLVAAFCSDALALFTGMACGKHKLSPLVSPHKTVEGAVGGLVGGMLGMVIFRIIFYLCTLQPLHIGGCILMGLVGALMGQLGDLSFSAIKRQYGIKDYGRLLPGHGGVLDRFDSVLFAAPVLCALLRALAA